MTAAVNIVDTDTRDLLSSAGSWAALSNCTVAQSLQQRKYDDTGTLRLQATANGDASTRATGFKVPSTRRGWQLRAHCWIYTDSARSVTITVTSSLTGATSKIVNVRGDRWTLLSVFGTSTSTSQVDETVSLTVAIAGMTAGEYAYVAYPVIGFAQDVIDNPFAGDIWLRIPQYLQEYDAAQDDPDAPLLRFIDTLYSSAGEVDRLFDDIRYSPPDDGGDATLSTLTWPMTCPIRYIGWLAQLVGVKLRNPNEAGTSWSALQGVAPSWTDWETNALMDQNDPADAVEWKEIEQYDTDFGDVEPYLRWQVRYAFFGIHAGTLNALRESVKFFLSGTKSITIATFVDGDPWKITITVLTAEAPADQSAVQEAIDATTPLGYEVALIVT